jgi:hypothetical protein
MGSTANLVGLLLTYVNRSMFGKSQWAGLTYIGWKGMRLGWWQPRRAIFDLRILTRYKLFEEEQINASYTDGQQSQDRTK